MKKPIQAIIYDVETNEFFMMINFKEFCPINRIVAQYSAEKINGCLVRHTNKKSQLAAKRITTTHIISKRSLVTKVTS